MMKYFKILLINISFVLIVTIILTDEKVVFYIEKPFIMLNLKFGQEVITTKNVIIVNIDRKSIELYGRWPWKREKIAELIDSISKYKPRVIGIEILFSNKSDDINDNAFNVALKKAGNVILGYNKEVSMYPFNYRVDSFQSSSFEIGFLDIVYTNSGEVSGIYPINKEKGKEYMAFALKIVEKYNDKIISSIKQDRLMRINFYGPYNTFKHYSASEFLEGKLTDFIQDKIIIISANILPLYSDTLVGHMPTSEIHANIIQNIIDNNWLKFNMFVNFIVCFIGGISFIFILIKNKTWVALLLAGVYLIFSYALFLKGIVISTVSFITVLLLNYFIFRISLHRKD